MKKIILNYYLEILTFIMFAMITGTAVFVQTLSTTRRILMVFMFLFTLHEWEENRFPGGFSNLMKNFAGREFEPEREMMSHIPVAVLLIVILIVPYIFDSSIFLVLIPIYLGIFECIVHIAGIFIHKIGKPYTPGLITAICMIIASVGSLRYISTNNLAHGKDYLLGLLCMFVSFAVMQRTVLAINGFGYKDIFATVRGKLSR